VICASFAQPNGGLCIFIIIVDRTRLLTGQVERWKTVSQIKAKEGFDCRVIQSPHFEERYPSDAQLLCGPGHGLIPFVLIVYVDTSMIAIRLVTEAKGERRGQIFGQQSTLTAIPSKLLTSSQESRTRAVVIAAERQRSIQHQLRSQWSEDRPTNDESQIIPPKLGNLDTLARSNVPEARCLNCPATQSAVRSC